MIKFSISNLWQEIFKAFSIAIVLFVILELVWPGIVIAYINLSVLLIFWLILGIFIVITNRADG